MLKRRMGFCVCGSYCSFSRILDELSRLCDTYDVPPILSEASATTDTRFGSAQAFRKEIEALTGKPAITTIPDAEPIGPGALFDVLVVAPCTGNTLAKLAAGVTDSSVTMAAKAHLRNGRPIILAISTNDGLAGSGANIGALLNRKHYYFVPFFQDDAENKPCSLLADFKQIKASLEAAAQEQQVQPILR